MAKYIGITIGPILTTLIKAKKSREIWGASYIFSFIMKKIIKEFKRQGRIFIVPHFDEKLLSSNQEYGIFPDRVIFKSEDNDFERIEKIKQEIFIDIANNANSIKKEDLEKYFQIYYCEIDFDSSYINKEIEIIDNIYNILDNLELETKFLLEESDKRFNIMKLFAVQKSIKSIFGVENPYPCIAKIAAKDAECAGNEIRCNDDDIIDPYSKIKIIRQCYKYIAIVQCDGDDMGYTIKEILKNNEDLYFFSKKLWDFSQNAKKIIEEYGGRPIYIGGDDLLFFAPVIYKGKTVIGLCRKLSEEFNDFFNEIIKKSKNASYKKDLSYIKYPSLSFGLSINYYKFPMGEAMEDAKNLLENFAKKEKTKFDYNGLSVVKEKNSIAFKVMKHSGQSFRNVFSIDSEVLKSFEELIREFLNLDKDVRTGSELVLNSLTFKINDLKPVIWSFFMDIDRDEKINNLFYNELNEYIHKKNFNAFIEYSKKFLKILLKYAVEECAAKENLRYSSFEKALDGFQNALRFIKFLEEKPKNEIFN